MIGVALKGLLGRKLRATLTAFAIVLGVAMISGSLVLTDTIGKSFDGIYGQSYAGADAVVSGKEAVSTGGAAPAFSADLLSKVQRVGGVNDVQGSIEDQARLADRKGKSIGTGGVAVGIDSTANQTLNPIQLVSGQWPAGEGEIAIDKSTATKKHFAVGETIKAYANGPVHSVQGHGHRSLRQGRLARRRDDRRLRPADGAATVRQAEQARPDPGRGEARRLGAAAREPHPPAPPGDGAGEDRVGSGVLRQQGHAEGRRLVPQVPARLRRDRTDRR